MNQETDHTAQFWHHPSSSQAGIVWNDSATYEPETDRQILTSSIVISGCNSLKNGGPACISQHNPNNSRAGTGWKVWCDRAWTFWAGEVFGVQFEIKMDCKTHINRDLYWSWHTKESWKRENIHTIEITRVVVLELHQIILEAAAFWRKIY